MPSQYAGCSRDPAHHRSGEGVIWAGKACMNHIRLASNESPRKLCHDWCAVEPSRDGETVDLEILHSVASGFARRRRTEDLDIISALDQLPSEIVCVGLRASSPRGKERVD